MKRIILDTNFLFLPYRFHIDIFDQLQKIAEFPYTVCIVDKTLDELKAVESRGGKNKEAVSLALLILRKNKVSIIKADSGKDVDSIIADLAGKDDIVATQDAPLKRVLRKKGIPIISMRQKGYLKLFYY